MLLHSLDCTDDAGIYAVKKEIVTLESAPNKLSEQEEKSIQLGTIRVQRECILNDALPLFCFT